MWLIGLLVNIVAVQSILGDFRCDINKKDLAIPGPVVDIKHFKVMQDGLMFTVMLLDLL